MYESSVSYMNTRMINYKMNSVRLFKEILVVFLVIKGSVAFSVEPKYTKFQYDQQLLEKMIRLEIYVEAMEKEVKKLIADSESNKTESGMDLDNVLKRNILDDLLSAQSTMKNDLDSLMKRMDILEQGNGNSDSGRKIVVFNAVSRTPQERSGSDDPVIFESILQNNGDGYNSSTGIFTVPVTGVYQFNAQLCANKDGNLEYGIDVGGTKIINGEFRAASDSDDEKCVSFSSAYLCNKDDKVFVQGNNCPLDAANDDLLYFSGVLIHEV